MDRCIGVRERKREREGGEGERGREREKQVSKQIDLHSKDSLGEGSISGT